MGLKMAKKEKETEWFSWCPKCGALVFIRTAQINFRGSEIILYGACGHNLHLKIEGELVG